MKFLRILAASLACATTLGAQTTPPLGIVESTPRTIAFTHATIVVSPGRTIEQATLVTRDGRIEAVGKSVKPPADARMVLVGGAEAHRAAAQLVEAGIPVILREVIERPLRQDDPYDLAYSLPALLHAAGVKFCLSNDGSWQVRNLPLQAGQAVAYGLPHDVALRAITLTTAEILGVDGELGSLDVGKRATLFIQDADPIDNFGSSVERMWIDGRAVDLDDRQRRLWQKYRRKP